MIFASRSETAASTSLSSLQGKKTRQMAVHFWPAFWVISATRPLTKMANSGRQG